MENKYEIYSQPLLCLYTAPVRLSMFKVWLIFFFFFKAQILLPGAFTSPAQMDSAGKRGEG